MSEVTFFYDFSSPYAYLGSTQIERVAKEANATVRWRPFLLGALFNKVGSPNVPLLTWPEPKRAYFARDMRHWAAYWQVPFHWPTRFPMNTVSALRLALAAAGEEGGDKLPALTHALFSAYWVDDRDLNDKNELGAIARAAGVSAATIERGLLPDPALKQALFASTDEAVAAGVFGAPSFLVRDHLFWGQDRLDLVARALAGWEPPK